MAESLAPVSGRFPGNPGREVQDRRESARGAEKLAGWGRGRGWAESWDGMEQLAGRCSGPDGG